MSTSEVATALGVSSETIRYHARKGRIPFEVTPGRHRRYRLAAVREALALDGGTPPGPARVALDLDFSEPHRQMTADAATRLRMRAGRDELALIHEHEKLDPESPLAPFTVAGTARYAPVVSGGDR